MSPIILLGLVVMWAVVLVPMWLRRHDEVEEARSVDRFVSAMHTLSRRETKVDPKRYGLVHRARDLEVHVSGASADGQKPPPRPYRKRTVTAADRRRRTLFVLLGLAVLTLALAVLIGGIALWVVQLIVDATLVAFVYYSRRCVTATDRRRPARPQRTARPVAPPAAPATPRPAARTAPQRRPVEVAHVEERYVDERDVDERYVDRDYRDEERFEPVAVPVPAAAFYDQDAAPAAPVVEFEASSDLFDQYQESEVRVAEAPTRRDVMKDPLHVAMTGADSPAATASGDLGSRPWDPVAVPKPSYATKPVAPPRRTRAPIMEPLLPPIETAAELDEGDDLEEILDRRWAVND